GGKIQLEDTAAGRRQYVLSASSALIEPLEIRQGVSFPSAEGNYVVITPAAFEETLQPLLSLRSSQGHTPAVITTEAIYDRFGDGQLSPEAIRDFIAYAYANWSIQPEMVLLVGDGTYDPKQNQPNSKATILPVYLADVDPWAGEVPADHRFVTVDGGDLLPDLAIGRLPVNDTGELAAVVAKLVSYPEQNKSWRGTWTFVADDADQAGDFTEASNELIHQLDSEHYRANLYIYSGDESDLSSLQSEVTSAWASGHGHVIYTGHSTVHQWADEGFYHISQINGLINRNQLSVMLQLTCFTGSFHMAGLDSIDETFLRHPNGGASAVWGATGLGVSTAHEELAVGYIQNLNQTGTTTIGAATMAGKINLLTERPHHADLVDTFTLLGDPAMILTLPGEGVDGIFLPLIQTSN
ncbi:MAG: C25 family cysteine peptidase, partial [Chloroflexota bacterium]